MPRLFVLAFTLGVGVALVYLMLDLKCKQLHQEIEKYEQDYATEEKKCILEKARWEAKQSPENMDRILLNHGLAMGFPTSAQIVRIAADGRMFPGQPSEARAKRVLVSSAAITHSQH